MHRDSGAFAHQSEYIYLEERKITLPLPQKNLVQYSHVGVSPFTSRGQPKERGLEPFRPKTASPQGGSVEAGGVAFLPGRQGPPRRERWQVAFALVILAEIIEAGGT